MAGLYCKTIVFALKIGFSKRLKCSEHQTCLSPVPHLLSTLTVHVGVKGRGGGGGIVEGKNKDNPLTKQNCSVSVIEPSCN